MPNEAVTNSPLETNQFAQNVLKGLSGGQVLALMGNLGAGKTTFVQGIGQALGVKRIISPTYTLIREYNLSHPTFDKLYHLDLYRLGSVEEVDALGIQELWQDPRALILIEWPEKIVDRLPSGYLTITFQQLEGDKRKITIT